METAELGFVPKFSDEDTLMMRLLYALGDSTTEKQVVFLVGAPISEPLVPGTEEICELIRHRLGLNHAGFTEAMERLDLPYRYQRAFAVLDDRCGFKACDAVIMEAVSRAHSGERPSTEFGWDDIEDDPDQWQSLPPGCQALAEIVVHASKRCRTLLTPNFDPLLRVGISAAGGVCRLTVLGSDGAPDQHWGKGCHIVHVHGYWRSRCLHTPLQLRHPRQRLQQALVDLLSNATLVVMAYGGWDDVLTSAITIAAEQGRETDVVWTFFGTDEQALIAQQHNLLKRFSTQIQRDNVKLFKGIDVHSFLPKLCAELKGKPSPRQQKKAISSIDDALHVLSARTKFLWLELTEAKEWKNECSADIKEVTLATVQPALEFLKSQGEMSIELEPDIYRADSGESIARITLKRISTRLITRIEAIKKEHQDNRTGEFYTGP